LEDNSIKPLLLDDTAILQEARTSPEQGIMILVNNLAGTETLDLTTGGQGPTGANYGNFAAASLSVPFGKPLIITTNVGSIAEDEAGVGQDPAMDFTVAFFGRFPGENFRDTQSGNTSELNALEFMKGFSGLGYEQNGHVFSFDTFLAAMETAGLTDMLTTGPYLMYVPTDEAFAALPKDQLDSLMADPQALADVLRYTIVEGYYPPGSFSSTTYGGVDRTLKNVLGDDLKLLVADGVFTINGITIVNIQRYQVANGSFVRPIPKLILPPSQ
jgi:Fasciclin domain